MAPEDRFQKTTLMKTPIEPTIAAQTDAQHASLTTVGRVIGDLRRGMAIVLRDGQSALLVTAAESSVDPRALTMLTDAGVACLVAVAFAAATLLAPSTALAGAKNTAAVAIAEPATMESLVKQAVSFVLHMDKHLANIFAENGIAAYGILFAIIFAETGFVVTPFLPGDSLLFNTGALGSLGVLNFPLALCLLFVAAVGMGWARARASVGGCLRGWVGVSHFLHSLECASTLI